MRRAISGLEISLQITASVSWDHTMSRPLHSYGHDGSVENAVENACFFGFLGHSQLRRLRKPRLEQPPPQVDLAVPAPGLTHSKLKRISEGNTGVDEILSFFIITSKMRI